MPLPFRPRILDSLGRPRTLASGPEAFEFLSWFRAGKNSDSAAVRGGPVLILGLGPCPADAVHLLETGAGPPEDAPEGAKRAQPSQRPVAWVECPDFERALAACGVSPLPPPPHWIRLEPEDAVNFAAEAKPAIWAYRQARRLFPDFWAPLFSRLQSRAIAPGRHAASRTVLLPGTSRDLLHLELWDALTAEGYKPVAPPPAKAHSKHKAFPARWLEAQNPAFCLSVNLRGLDPDGETFHLLEALGVPVAVWFVDNPWHILSALRMPWWKKAVLFVSDATFIPELRRHGADRVYPLPLAASPLFQPRTRPSLPSGSRILFVGRSTFPGRDAFFGAAHPPVELLRRAGALLESGGRPDFHWWLGELGLTSLWPGHDARAAGAGAEACSLQHRTLWLKKLAPLGLAVVGDKGWHPWLPPGPPETPLLPPVDYYTALPGLYRAAPYTLNVTSLLLPGGLTQRHFDVWQAGGFLLSSRTSGLDIFPPELVEPVLLEPHTPPDECISRLELHPGTRRDLQHAWRALLDGFHTYRHRIRFAAECLGRRLDGDIASL
ncbi:MAG: glycosyltransferase [Desulfovibrionaceae bacterium]|nr:glycosyltransferase [Desulfovibrionaceae bacterium]